MTESGAPGSSADLATFSVMRAVLSSRRHRAGPAVDAAVAADDESVSRIVDDLQQRFGRDAVVALISALARKALAPIEQRAERAGTAAAAELAAEEQRLLEALDASRRGGA